MFRSELGIKGWKSFLWITFFLVCSGFKTNTGNRSYSREEEISSTLSSNIGSVDETKWSRTYLWDKYAYGAPQGDSLGALSLFSKKLKEFGDKHHPNETDGLKKYTYDSNDQLPSFENDYPICFMHSRNPGSNSLKLRLYSLPCNKVREDSVPVDEYQIMLSPFEYWGSSTDTKPRIDTSRALIVKEIDGKSLGVGSVQCFGEGSQWVVQPTGPQYADGIFKTYLQFTTYFASSEIVGTIQDKYWPPQRKPFKCADMASDTSKVKFYVRHFCTGLWQDGVGENFLKACSIVFDENHNFKGISYNPENVADRSGLFCTECRKSAGGFLGFFYSQRYAKNDWGMPQFFRDLTSCEQAREKNPWCRNERIFRRVQ